ncbi:MAG TPA: transposase [Anaerolineales bacterium]|nr:transposase [Anaerolineales bacterium]
MTPDCSNPVPSIPKETARAANAIFGRSNFYIVVGEHLDTLLEGVQLPGLAEKECAARREGALWALITYFQFLEGLTDVQAVDAVRTRIDWKFALHLSLIPARFHEYVFCAFRQRLLTDSADQQEFQKLTDRITALVPSLTSSSQNPNSLEVASFVCFVNRLNHAQQAMNQVLEILAARFPDWLRKMALPHWYGRYNRTIPRLEAALLLGQQRFLMEEIGADIHHLLERIHHSGSCELAELDEVKILDQVWAQQFSVLGLRPNYWQENSNLRNCDTCAYGGAGRRH